MYVFVFEGSSSFSGERAFYYVCVCVCVCVRVAFAIRFRNSMEVCDVMSLPFMICK